MKPAPVVTKSPAKKATNISLSIEVYEQARRLGINISQVCEQRLREEIQVRMEQEWNEQNAEFIKAYNNMVDSEGVALQEWRAF